MLQFTSVSIKAQKYLLRGYEIIVGLVHKEVLLPESLRILHTLYDHRLVDEDIVRKWFTKLPSKKYITLEVSKTMHGNVAPFITWLDNADEESNDEDDDVKVQTYSYAVCLL